MRRLLLALAGIASTVVVLFLLYYAALLTPDCPKPERYQVGTLKGRVVGMSFELLQYRWLRRLFTPAGTRFTLMLDRWEDRPPPTGRIWTPKPLQSTVIDQSGRFDFGSLPPDRYDLSVSVGGYNSGFGIVIDPAVHNQEVLLDVSPAIYCRCCGMDLELR